MMGKVYIHKNYRTQEKCKLVYMNGKLFCRSSQATNKALVVIDPVTLDEIAEPVILDKTN
jgi:hypothetical protein